MWWTQARNWLPASAADCHSLLRDWDGFRPGSLPGVSAAAAGAAADLVRRFRERVAHQRLDGLHVAVQPAVGGRGGVKPRSRRPRRERTQPSARRNLRKSWGVAAVGQETALLALGGPRYSGEAERDDDRASVNPGLFVMPVISIRKVVVESCRRLVGSSAEARSNVAGEHAYQHFMIISSPRGASGRAVRLESGQ
jgi:hypothetical protein